MYMKAWIFLFIAIFSEVVGTTSMKLSLGFTKIIPIFFVLIGYGSALYFLAISMTDIPLGIAYAVWAGLGTVCASLIGKFIFSERFGSIQIVGTLFIIIGIMVLHLSQRGAK